VRETTGREFTRTGVAHRGLTDGVVLFVQLILHIGTHKTGTSALQKCLRRNEQILADKGIYYARIAGSKNSNRLGRLIANSRRAEVRAFVDRNVDKASTLGADVLVISAESLYAMSIFFHKFDGRQYHDYWKSESEAIEFLHSVLPPDMPTKLTVFFRRQDHFLESLYRQVVKSHAVAKPIDEFRLFMSEALDYWRHMEIWSAVFPDCAVYAYEEVSNNISSQRATSYKHGGIRRSGLARECPLEPRRA
jgi:hypothetical protein